MKNKMIIKYFGIFSKEELSVLKGKSASYKNLTFSFSDEYLQKLADLFDKKNCIQLFAKDSESDNVAGYIAAAETFEKDYLTIVELFVDPLYQRKGVGTGLIEKAIEYAKKKNLNGAITQTEFENIPAQKLYEKFGFVKIENPEWSKGVTYRLEFAPHKK